MLKKKYKKEHIMNWYFGNYCAKCGKIDLKSEDYGRKCYKKMKEIIQGIDGEEITHKEFVNIIRNSSFCKFEKREFSNNCPICKKLGVPRFRF
jgi:hypothetical protein